MVNPDGTTQIAHPGITVQHPSTGTYVISWTGFPGAALDYVQGVGTNGTVVGDQINFDGTGTFTVQFPADALFHVALIGVSG